MEVGSAQSQSLIASISITQTQIKATQVASQDGNATASVLLSVGTQIDATYVQKVLDTSLTDKLNGAFKTAGMDTNVQSLMSSGMDFSPEATAKRIVDFSVGFFGAFQLNHKGEKGGLQIDGFTSLIKDAVKTGFEDARSILSGIGDISPEISAGIDETFDLVMKGIDDFGEEQQGALIDPEAVEDSEEEGEQLLVV